MRTALKEAIADVPVLCAVLAVVFSVLTGDVTGVPIALIFVYVFLSLRAGQTSKAEQPGALGDAS